jgi:hypothetical protein
MKNGDSPPKLLLLLSEQSAHDDHHDTDSISHDDSANGASSTRPEPVQLPELQLCYVSKNMFRQLHPFYEQLCPDFAILNWHKRHQSAILNWHKRHQCCDLTGKATIVTAARVKIGYQTCVKLLRAWCTYIALCSGLLRRLDEN